MQNAEVGHGGAFGARPAPERLVEGFRCHFDEGEGHVRVWLQGSWVRQAVISCHGVCMLARSDGMT